jgi:hypothetical protein
VGYLGVYGRILLTFIIENSSVQVVTGLNWLRLGSNGGFSDHGHGPSVYLNQKIS